MNTTEKSILRGIYTIIILMFALLAVSERSLDYGALIIGIASCVLVAYGHFVIKRFFPEGDKFLLIISAFLVQFGLIMLYRLNPPKAWKQLIWFTLGMTVYILLVVFLPEIKKFARFRYTYIVIAILLLASTLVFGTEIKGSQNWIRFGSYSIQPSEIAKLFLILYLASAIQHIRNFKDVVITAIPVFIAIALLVIEKDLGAGLIFFGIYIAMLYIGTSNLLYILVWTSCFLAGGFLSYFIFPHVRVRVQIWLDPWQYATGRGLQIVQSLFAIAAGGLFGTGLGLGHPELIPEVHNDFIFSAICEEFGLLGAFAVLILYLLLVYRGLRTAIYTENNFSRLVAVGISTMLAFQVFVIIGGVTKMIPLTGIAMPFVSAGGSSMLLNFAALGVLQKISETVEGE